MAVEVFDFGSEVRCIDLHPERTNTTPQSVTPPIPPTGIVMSDRAYLARIVVSVFVSTIVLLTMPVLLAQEVPATAVLFPNFSEPGFTFSKRVDEVQLIFTVTDKRGHFIDKLGVDDFRLFDNEMPEHLYNFEQRTNLPLQVVLLIDISSSVQVRFKFE